ncbi:MAG TPA: HAMP domain-containing histidine kinase [Gammaproteobacteria bacterium]|nr:HAMP domain-containing histidine kinase [Gammaproteobacteria bacterium]
MPETDSIRQLEQAFALFNEISGQLTGSWQALQAEVRRLTDERARMARDVEALRHELAHSRRLAGMGQMTARLAHQIRTPLSTALLYASQLLKPELPPAQRACFVERLLTGLRHLDHMVNDMLLFAREGRVEGAERVDPRALLDQVRECLAPRLEALGADWQVQCRGEIPPIPVQREVLVSALGNLASNALAAGGEGVRLRWVLAVDGDWLELALEDNGPGVPEDARERLFEPFFTTHANGTGLGLAVVEAVVTAHQGTVALDPEWKQGARFVLRLPFEAAAGNLASALTTRQRVETTAQRCVNE